MKSAFRLDPRGWNGANVPYCQAVSASPLSGPVPTRSVAKPATMRLTCTLALACLIASCAPPKAIVIGDDPAAKPTAVAKNSTPTATGDEAVTPPSAERRAMMGYNRAMTERLPDRKDMQPTAPPLSTADRGPNLLVPAPKPAAPSE